ncbi:MAG: serine/threonine protein kinase [Christensenellales bacterium]
MTVNIWTLICALGIPTAITSLGLFMLQRRIKRREAKDDEREAARQKHEVLTVKGINAAIALGEATATALKNGHCNGETDAALAFAQKVKHETKDFLTEQSMKHIY